MVHDDAGTSTRKTIPNTSGEKLVGVLREASSSSSVVILCHGFGSSKEDKILLNLSSSLTTKGITTFRFDFSGNGESQGSFQYGNYKKEAEDLRSVVLYFFERKRDVRAIVGHSKGGNAVLLYASKYRDIHTVVNISGRFALERGIEGRLGKAFMNKIKNNGYIDVKDKSGQFLYRVTEESLMDRLSTDMCAACVSIDRSCRVLTIHGSEDEIVPKGDAFEFAKFISNHKLHIIDGANHHFTSHQVVLASIIVDFFRFSHILLDESNELLKSRL